MSFFTPYTKAIKDKHTAASFQIFDVMEAMDLPFTPLQNLTLQFDGVILGDSVECAIKGNTPPPNNLVIVYATNEVSFINFMVDCGYTRIDDSESETHKIFFSKTKTINGVKTDCRITLFRAIYQDWRDVLDSPYFKQYCFCFVPNRYEAFSIKIKQTNSV